MTTATPEAPGRFHDHWFANEYEHGRFSNAAVDAGITVMGNSEHFDPTVTVEFTDVSLRDGLQQRTNETTIEERTEIFDAIVATGVKRIEIGHLGNERVDQQFASQLVSHIKEKREEDDMYQDLELQVLFGSQAEKIVEGSEVLRQAYQEAYPESWENEMEKGIVVHVYDRVDENLTKAASEPYTIRKSAIRVANAAVKATEQGFKKFSISGEATTATEPEKAIQYYRSITSVLLESGAREINVNLPNTYGYSANASWNVHTIAAFVGAVKHDLPEGSVTTSIHSHNDVDNGLEFTKNAMVAGVDYVEGTHTGTGERSGNVANIDVMARLIEASRHEHLQSEGEMRLSSIAMAAGKIGVKRQIKISPRIVENLGNWYGAGDTISRILGEHAEYRFHRTAVGNPYAHDNGSGPHDQIMAASIKDPENFPGDATYEWFLMASHILGRPKAKDIAMGDPEAVDEITVGNHAGGGKTDLIKNGLIERADEAIIQRASRQFDDRAAKITGKLVTGTTVYAA